MQRGDDMPSNFIRVPTAPHVVQGRGSDPYGADRCLWVLWLSAGGRGTAEIVCCVSGQEEQGGGRVEAAALAGHLSPPMLQTLSQHDSRLSRERASQ